MRLKEQERQRQEEMLGTALDAIADVGYGSLWEFIDALLSTENYHHSSRVTRMLQRHGNDLLDHVRKRCRDGTTKWAASVVESEVETEGGDLCQLFHPPAHSTVTDALAAFEPSEILSRARTMAPCLFRVLDGVTKLSSRPDPKSVEIVSKALTFAFRH